MSVTEIVANNAHQTVRRCNHQQMEQSHQISKVKL